MYTRHVVCLYYKSSSSVRPTRRFLYIEHVRNASVGAITDFTPSVPAIKFIKEKPKKPPTLAIIYSRYIYIK